MGSKVVSDTGPIIHLHEIGGLGVLNIFYPMLIPPEVEKELQKNKVPLPRKIRIIFLKSNAKDTAKILTSQYSLDLGEAEAIALTIQEKADYFLTDDLDARTIAKNYNLEVHGTIGIILRAFRQKKIDKEIAIKKINDLYKKSSLFITRDLVEEILKAIQEFQDHT